MLYTCCCPLICSYSIVSCVFVCCCASHLLHQGARLANAAGPIQCNRLAQEMGLALLLHQAPWMARTKCGRRAHCTGETPKLRRKMPYGILRLCSIKIAHCDSIKHLNRTHDTYRARPKIIRFQYFCTKGVMCKMLYGILQGSKNPGS